MMGAGPEWLLVNSRIVPQAGIAEYLKPEYSRMEVRAVEEMIRRELEMLPVRRSAVQRLMRWGSKRLRPDKLPLAAGPAVWAKDAGADARSRADAHAQAAGPLAALPAIRGAAGAAAGGCPIAAAPLFARD